jgi:hypothetical protein
VGWFPKATADKLKAGQRDLDGEWRPKAEVEKVRRQWDRAWEVETEHFLVRSNLPWEEVQALAGEAEDLCRAFLRVFGVAWRIPPATERMTIHCHATIEEFKSAVASVDPRAVNSPGFYNTNTAVSYFFKRDGYLTTVLHECTHQVMHRIASSSPGVTARPQFWLFEGLASYFETYEGPVSRPTFFRSSTPKLEGLRKMAASGSGVLSLAEFTALTQEGFMGKQDRYFQAMGLVHFLLEGEAGRFRRRFLEYARMVAAGEGTEASFTDAFGDDARAIESGWRASCR